MAVSSLGSETEGQTDRHPLLMEHPGNHNGHEHVVDIPRTCIASASTPHADEPSDTDELYYEDRPSAIVQPPRSQSPPSLPTAPSSRDISLTRRDNYGSRQRSPLNSGYWISVELVVNLSQIIAAIIVLVLSRHEHPQSPLFAWVIGYTIGCIATLPHLYWRYIHHNSQGSEQDPSHLRRNSAQNNHTESSAYTAITVNQRLGGEDNSRTAVVSLFGQNLLASTASLTAFVEHSKMALDCFFAIWFVIGNVWVFGRHYSVVDAPNLYRLCIVFLAFSCIGYAMPFVLCAAICCCLPCIISIIGFREELGYTRGANPEAINALPKYRFKGKRGRNGQDNELSSESTCEGGILAPGTDKERVISAEDAVCCICLAKYTDNEELRELPCSHFFHVECIDKWLKINALCPLCKAVLCDPIVVAAFGTNSVGHQNEQRVQISGNHREPE